MEIEDTQVCLLNITTVHWILCPGIKPDLFCDVLPSIIYNIDHDQKNASKPHYSMSETVFFP